MSPAPKLREGSHVICEPSPAEQAAHIDPPAGVWHAWSRGSAAGRWWLTPSDDTSKTWAVNNAVRWIERHHNHMRTARKVPA